MALRLTTLLSTPTLITTYRPNGCKLLQYRAMLYSKLLVGSLCRTRRQTVLCGAFVSATLFDLIYHTLNVHEVSTRSKRHLLLSVQEPLNYIGSVRKYSISKDLNRPFSNSSTETTSLMHSTTRTRISLGTVMIFNSTSFALCMISIRREQVVAACSLSGHSTMRPQRSLRCSSLRQPRLHSFHHRRR